MSGLVKTSKQSRTEQYLHHDWLRAKMPWAQIHKNTSMRWHTQVYTRTRVFEDHYLSKQSLWKAKSSSSAQQDIISYYLFLPFSLLLLWSIFFFFKSSVDLGTEWSPILKDHLLFFIYFSTLSCFITRIALNSKGNKVSRLLIALCECMCVSVCVCGDQSKASINPMCQSGKNQAQLGSRTVEEGVQVCEGVGARGGGGVGVTVRLWRREKEQPIHFALCACVCVLIQFQRWEGTFLELF